MTCLRRLVLLVVVLWPLTSAARGSNAGRRGQLILTVTDQTAGVPPGATVTITGLGAVKMAAPLVVQTADKGIATVEKLAPGKTPCGSTWMGSTPR